MAWFYACTISGILVPISLWYTYYRYKFIYFDRRGIPHIKPPMLSFKERSKELINGAYDKFKSTVPVVGIFLENAPTFVVLDLDLVKRILIDDFQSFSDGLNENENYSPDNAKWQAILRRLTPAFWSVKMAHIFPSVMKAAECLRGKSSGLLPSEYVTIDVKALFIRYAASALLSCVFGIELDDASDPAMALRLRIKDLLEQECKTILSSKAKGTLVYAECTKCTQGQAEPQEFSELEEVVLKARIEKRTKEPSNNNILQLLAEMMADDEEGDSEINRLDYELHAMRLAVRSIALLLTGFAHLALTLVNCVRELVENTEVQRELRQEIVDVLQSSEDQFNFEAMARMHYLDQVVSETLRKYPATELLIRRTIREYHIPNTLHVIERKATILVPVYAIHHDPSIYPNPEQFDPARFNAAAVMARHSCAYLSFDDGPRTCWGKRLSTMLIKVAVVTLLHKHTIAASEDAQQPVEERKTDDESISEVMVKLQRV
ncbi:probable cytochrome P450 6a14 [Bactrocera dorsalis]|uniref:Probable cytochrome P450 6a14 n=1 Tax=Bactrocera dorsalis TaxID=27457 RepID=A0A6I9VPV1_BACDO|nr:probable cytochrome P450 6a14 [Bactrocera dorsalis]